MKIEKRDVVAKLTDYLNHRITLHELVAWAELAMMDGNFVGKDWKAVRDVVARIGVADVRAFGLTWEDCEKSLTGLGYRAKVEVSQVVA
jgi:hypothetical protein